ncbi:inositol-phosphate transport system permease protein [Desulfohalotomaculum tongense]|uniref:ABC transporter permease subunit n=1 Tax=Desulforadius tongensis TaxID=1216062 RepID=UPI001958F2EF|nr:inositol-phosphate transport system permease protein [Desulforadius tongensis]
MAPVTERSVMLERDAQLEEKNLFQKLKDTCQAASFLAPFLIMIILFFAVPVILTAVLAFSGMDFKLQWNFVGLDNFIRILKDPVIPQVAANTLVYVVFTCIINVGFGFLLAVMTAYFIKNESVGLFFRTLWLLPRMTPSVVYALLWIWFLEPTENGMLNIIFKSLFDMQPHNWIQDNPMKVIIFANGMIGASFGMIVFSAAIKSIPEDYFRAAMVDGANDFQIIKNIIIPFLKWPIMFATIWQTLSLLTSYEYILLLTDGGPLFDSEVLSLFAYHKAFANFEFGYGAASAMVLVIIGALITLLMLKLFGYERMMNPSKLGN